MVVSKMLRDHKYHSYKLGLRKSREWDYVNCFKLCLRVQVMDKTLPYIRNPYNENCKLKLANFH